MIFSLYQKMQQLKNRIVTLRFSILSIFSTFFVITILLIIILSYFRGENVALFVADKLMTEISAKSVDEVRKEMLWTEDGDKLTAHLIQDHILNIQDTAAFVDYVIEFIKRFDLVQAVFWGDENGNYRIVELEPDHKFYVTTIDRNLTPSMKIYINDALSKVSMQLVSTSNNANYDPRLRPWYQAAKTQRNTIWTSIYESLPSHRLALTTATPVYEKNGQLRGVIAFSIRLDFLSSFVSTHSVVKNGYSFIVTNRGELIAFSEPGVMTIVTHLKDIHTVSIPWVAKAFDIYQKTGNKKFDFSYQRKNYLANFEPIPEGISQSWTVGVVVPQDEFTASLKRASIADAGLSLFILAIGVFLVSKWVNRIVNPIKRLVKQTEKIKQFKLANEKRVYSRIKEVMLLSDAIYALRVGLKAFQKYVPASLVRQLIETGENARIGGTKKNLSIMFSDIENFTTIAEKADPDQLMKHICEYFDELSKIITAEKGTIDKYIGDSIMAFWGAPLAVDNPCQHAAQAALRCMRKLDELNLKWQREGKPILITRIGLHTGDAIVGNVGSSRRMNYTALGDAINVTSRLEKLNKTYGTRIIVSDEFYQFIKDQFILRKLDCIAVKGKTERHDIYELIAKK